MNDAVKYVWMNVSIESENNGLNLYLYIHISVHASIQYKIQYRGGVLVIRSEWNRVSTIIEK